MSSDQEIRQVPIGAGVDSQNVDKAIDDYNMRKEKEKEQEEQDEGSSNQLTFFTPVIIKRRSIFADLVFGTCITVISLMWVFNYI